MPFEYLGKEQVIMHEFEPVVVIGARIALEASGLPRHPKRAGGRRSKIRIESVDRTDPTPKRTVSSASLLSLIRNLTLRVESVQGSANFRSRVASVFRIFRDSAQKNLLKY